MNDEHETGGGTPFLKRWAQRKQANQAGKAVPEKLGSDRAGATAPNDDDDRATPPADPTATASIAAEPAFDPATLPAIGDLTSTSDITAFLQRGVPAELKRLALRRAWSLDPQIRDFIEVAENQYDWNAPGGVPGFGALAEGTDVEALLAQATGRLRTLVPGAESEDSVAMAAATSNDDGTQKADGREPARPTVATTAESAPTEGAIRRTAVAGREGAGLVSMDTVPALTASETSSLVPRRRHGGALPQT